ncbi:hypothetical protein PENTCL1PPCAC_9992, partial [Pristionchus entomophagus]
MAWGQSAQSAPPHEQQPVGLSFFPSAGTKVEFTTALGGTVTGNVVAFDIGLNVLAVKEAVGGGKTLLRVFNIKLISDIREISCATDESTADAAASAQSSQQQANERKIAAVTKRLAEALSE